MMTYLFPLMDVISQTKACIFSVSMENRAVKLGYLSQTQNNANKKQQQNNQLQALHFLLWQNELPQMKNPRKLKPACLMLTSDLEPFMSLFVWLCLCSSSCLLLPASQKKKQVKMTSQDLNCSTKRYRVTMSVHDLKFIEDSTAYHEDEHQNRSIRLRKVILRFMPGCHIFRIPLTSAEKHYAPIYLNYICPPFFLILCKFSFPYCLWLCCLCLRLKDERKGNTTTNSKGKKVCTIPNKRLGKCNLGMLSICIYPCRVAVKKITTLNICIRLTLQMTLFQTLKELLETVLDHLELIWVDAYFSPFTGNLWSQAVFLFINTVKIVCYVCYVMFNKENIHKSNP